MRTSSRGCLAAAVALAALATSVVPALAANPRFVRAAASVDGTGNLVVSFRIAGLTGAAADVVASADAHATWGCLSAAGITAREDVAETVAAGGQFGGQKNAPVTGSLTLAPPAGTLSCVTGEALVLVAVAYTSVQVSETSAGAEDIPGTFSATFY